MYGYFLCGCPITSQYVISRQQTLDGNLSPHVPPFTKYGLMDYIVKLIFPEDAVHQYKLVLNVILTA